jgi:hypothetical protein
MAISDLLEMEEKKQKKRTVEFLKDQPSVWEARKFLCFSL